MRHSQFCRYSDESEAGLYSQATFYQGQMDVSRTREEVNKKKFRH